MGEAVCLRCDWAGPTEARRCPRCGVPLFRVPEPGPRAGPAPPSVGLRNRAAARVSAAARPPAPEPSAPGPPAREPSTPGPPAREAPGAGPAARALLRPPLRPATAAGLALALALGLAWGRGRPPTAPPPAEPLALGGRLVYASDVARRHQRLWVLDLRTGRLRSGPRIPRATDLVASTGGWGTWVGFLSRSPGGGVRAFVLRDLSPGARPEPVGRGDLAAWGPQATSLVLVRRGPLSDDCRRRVAVVFVAVEPRARTVVYRRPSLCGDVVSVGRDQASTYFTVVTREGGGIFIPGFQRRPHPVLPGHALLSVAPTGRMLVAPLGAPLGGGGIGPWGARVDRDPPPRPMAGPAAVWGGVGRPAPIASGSERLVVGRVLAWSPSAARALVVGVLHDLLGVFAVETASDATERTPRLVTALRGAVGATFARDGTALLAMGGRLYAVREGGLRDVPLPEGAPIPSGPVVWLP